MFIKANEMVTNLKILHQFFCLSSILHAINETFLSIFNALKEISLRLPMGVPTRYKTLFSGSGLL